MIVKEKMKGISTLKDELIGIFKSGTSYSSKFTFIEHLFEETTIRKKNGQNIIIIFLVFLIHFFKKLYSNQIAITDALKEFSLHTVRETYSQQSVRLIV